MQTSGCNVRGRVVHDELSASATRLCDYVLDFNVMLPELEAGPVGALVPGVAAHNVTKIQWGNAGATYSILFVAILLFASTMRPPWSATS